MRRSRGFTLIELMIVVAIIGVIASIAIPKFAEMIRKSSEGSSKGNLGSLRSALNIYYSDMEGTYASDLAVLTAAGKFLRVVPDAKTPDYHPASSTIDDNDDFGMGAMFVMDNGRWRYWNWQAGMNYRSQGMIWVGCGHTDSKGTVWTSY
jgi:prepilin-type N-terminal cleavage/methylation domain-containing protein